MTNLRFADDVLLIACSKSDASKMITDLGRESFKFGLKLHMGKTKVLTSCFAKRPSSITCCGQQVQVLDPTEAEKYLACKLSADSFHDTGLANRMACAWSCFFKLKHV